MTDQHYDRTYIAYLDILGFKEIVDSTTHEILLNRYDLLHENVLISSTHSNIDLERQMPKLSEAKINSIQTADNIILWTDGTSLQDFIDICLCVKNLYKASMIIAMLLRGTITIGEFTAGYDIPESNKTHIIVSYLGKALIEAYNNTGRQEWMGCVINGACVDQFTDEQINQLITRRLITQYKVPYADGPVTEDYVVCWFDGRADMQNIVPAQMRSYGQDIDDWRLERKKLNTMKFMEDTSLKD